MRTIKGAETRRCPKEFQDRITRLFGRNRFGDPNFRIVWGQSEFIRQGNVWRDAQGNERGGYIDRYACHGMPCWVIMRWKPPESYGSPRTYYAQTWMAAKSHLERDPNHPHDSPRGFYITGEYPWKGRYEIMQPLISKEYKDGKLVVTHFPLSHYMIDRLIPMFIAFQRLSEAEKAAARVYVREQEERKQTAQIADILEQNLPTWWGPVSYGGQGVRTSLLDRKMDQIQRVWDAMTRTRKPVFNRGMSVGDRPIIAAR